MSTQTVPSKQGRVWSGTLALLVMIAALVAWAPQSRAYEEYSDPTSGTGNCLGCHGDFRAGGYVSRKDATPWSTDLMSGHVNMLSSECSACHGGAGGGFGRVVLGASTGGGGLAPIGCLGCHGRPGDAGNPANPALGACAFGSTTSTFMDPANCGSGAGLREHHADAGIGVCAGCHSNDPAAPVGEDALPVYYADPGTGHPNIPADPCNAAAPPRHENKFGPTGLDNDGDGLDDGADTADCGGAEPDIALNPTSLDFGAVFIGDTSTLTGQIENAGSADLTVTGIAPGAGTSAEFSFTAPATPFVVAPGGSQGVSVTYGPVDLGADSGSLEVTSDDPDEPTVSLALTGSGEAAPVADINLSPAALDFGTVFIGSTSTLTSQVENLGTADLVISLVDLCAGTSTEFSFVPLGSTTIPPGGAQSLSVSYAPVDEGADTGCLEIQSNDPDETVANLDLDGNGAAVPVPDINLAPVALDFGVVTVGGTSALTGQIENVGAADLTVTGIAPGAGTSAEFTFAAPATPFVVAAGGSQAVTVTYAPVDVGLDSGSLEIASDDPDEPTVSLGLSGTGEAVAVPDINLDPAALDFGVVTVGGASTLTSQVENLGTADLVVSLVDLCAGTSAEFGFVPLASTTIPPAAAETLSVIYTPVDAGTDTGCIAITSNDPDEGTVNLDLAGTGEVLVPDINLDPAALDFGVVTIGDTATLSAVIENLGTAGLTIGSILPAAGTSAEFGFTAPATPFTIPVGGSQSVTVTYAPADVGLDTGALEIASDDPDEPLVALDLSGTGQEPTVLEPDINLDPAALDFGTVLLGGASTLTAEIQNLGTSDLLVTMVNSCVGTSGEFGFTDPTPVTILPGGMQPLSVTYTPADVGTDAGCLEVLSDDPDEPLVELGLTGTGTEPGGVEEVEVVVPGAINPENRGVTPIKLLADRDLDVAFVACGPAEAEPRRLNMDDVNDDGFMDVVGLFETRALGLACGDETLTCEGVLADGTSFEGVSEPFKTVGRACHPAGPRAASKARKK